MILCSFCSVSSSVDNILLCGLNTGNICEERELRRGAQLEWSGKLSPLTTFGEFLVIVCCVSRTEFGMLDFIP